MITELKTYRLVCDRADCDQVKVVQAASIWEIPNGYGWSVGTQGQSFCAWHRGH